MGALAAMLKSRGYKITGSDQHVYPPMSTFLQNQGIIIYSGFDSAHLNPKPDLVIIGNAMSRGNPEVEAVLEQKINYTSMPAALKEFFIRGKQSIVVTGTHGKTTTSSLITWLLEHAGKKPNFLIGGIPQNFNQGFKLDDGDMFVIEGDEYDTAFFDKAAKFFHYLPDIVVLNNIEFDHADIYDNVDQIKLVFKRLINLIPRNGLLLAGSDDGNVRELIPAAFCPVQTFAINLPAFWTAHNIEHSTSEMHFEVCKEGRPFGHFSIPLSGNHNILNTLAAIGVAHHHGLTNPVIQSGLSSFRSVKKRLEIRAIIDDIILYDDFAHHPTAVKHTVEGLKLQYPQRKLWAIFEPRTATTKRKVMEEGYSKAFNAADVVILAPLHLPEKVKEADRLSVKNVVAQIRAQGIDAYYMLSVQNIVNYISDHIHSGDLLLIMSNGAFGGIHDLLIERLSSGKYGQTK